MTEIVDRIAKSILLEVFGCVESRSVHGEVIVSPQIMMACERAARAAIEEMKRPTDEMFEIFRKQGGIEGYEAMMEAALQ